MSREDLDRAPEPLYHGAGLVIRAVTLAEEPELVKSIARQRAIAFHGPGPWNYGLDAYDTHAIQIVSLDETTGEPVGAIRLGLGDKVLAQEEPSAFYLQDFWELSPGTQTFFGAHVESGRIWVRRGHPRLMEIVQGLRHATGIFLARHGGYQGLFGTVALRDYPEDAQQLIVSYLRKYHPWGVERIRPRIPYGYEGWQDYLRASEGWSQPAALRRLFRALRHVDATQALLFLLYTYLKQGAELLGDVSVDPLGWKLLIPIYTSAANLQGHMAQEATASPGP